MSKKKPTRENAVLFHHPDGVETRRPQLMGRHAAGEGFLQGYVRHSGAKQFFCQAMEQTHFDDFKNRVSNLDDDERACQFVPLDTMAGVSGVSTLHLPGPGLAPFAWRRRAVGGHSYSITGLNHTISSNAVMDGLGQLLTAPVQSWDALICTSSVVKSTINHVLDNWSDYLALRFSIDAAKKPKPIIQMPVIPLGVDCRAYNVGKDHDRYRMNIRHGLGIQDDDVAVLYFGRLSFHAKAHPLAMLLGLEKAATDTGRKVHLIQAGWFANEAIEKEFREAMRNVAPSVNGIFLDAREEDVRFNVWFAADIFTSLSDNVQESFGLTPIEAMAAGLPVVVSDWNGYRDTVRHGLDGFAVPTWLPLADSGGDLAMAPELDFCPDGMDKAYNHYCGHISQCTAIDVEATATAFRELIHSRELRLKMGASGKKHAQQHFDWSVVVRSYQDLWRELAHIRNREDETAAMSGGGIIHPLKDDPFSVFKAYPTGIIEGETRVYLATKISAGGEGRLGERLDRLSQSRMNNFALRFMLDQKEMLFILSVIDEKGSASVFELAELVDEDKRYRLPRSLAWLGKVGLLNFTAARSGENTADNIGLAPEKSEVQRLLDLGTAARLRGVTKSAKSYFQRAVDVEPDHAIANTQLGELLAEQKRYAEAIRRFRKAVMRQPDYLHAHRNLGKALTLSGDLKSGIAALQKAIRIGADDSESHYLLGAAYRRAANPNKAVPILEKCLKLGGPSVETKCHLGLAKKSLGKSEQALKIFNDALKEQSTNIYVLSAIASMEIEQTGIKNTNQHIKTRTQKKPAKKIGLHILNAEHYKNLRPLFDVLSENHWPLISGDARELVEFDPDVVIVAGSQSDTLRGMMKRTRFVHIGDTVVGKNDAHMREKMGSADYCCVSGKPSFEALADTGILTEDSIWMTGFLSMDPLFRQDQTKSPFKSSPALKTVLFCPSLATIETTPSFMGELVFDVLIPAGQNVRLVVMPHAAVFDSRPDWINRWEQVEQSDEKFQIINDPLMTIEHCMLHSDVLVTDQIDLACRFLPLDKPIILYTPTISDLKKQGLSTDVTLDYLRDFADTVDDIEDLSSVILKCLRHPDRRTDIRARYRDLLFSSFDDGQSINRIVDKITDINLTQ